MSGLLCLIVAILPFLLTRGPSLDSPLLREAAGMDVSLLESGPDSPVNGDEQDFCLPIPLDPDPSDDVSGMALHIDTLLRKDSRYLPLPAKSPILRFAPGEIPRGFPVIGLHRAESPALPFFGEFPVFLISDLPPPAV